MDRRRFLQHAGKAIVAAPAVSALLATSRVLAAPPWATLAAQLTGRLIRPGMPAYPRARLGYDPRFDGIRPRAIVQAANPADVARTIAFAQANGLRFAARCGGHSYGGYSLSNGIVIDVSPMATVHPHPAAQTATIGAGARLIDVAAGLAPGGRDDPERDVRDGRDQWPHDGRGPGRHRPAVRPDQRFAPRGDRGARERSDRPVRRERASGPVLGAPRRRRRELRRRHVVHVRDAPRSRASPSSR